MGGWHHEGAFKEKGCAVCGTPFTPKSGVHKFCSETCKGKWKYITGDRSTANQYKEISGNWNRYFARLVNRSFNRSELTVADCLEALAKQDGKCAISGVELTCLLEKGVRTNTNASIDRIKAGAPYSKDNIQLVCAAVNRWRSDTALDEFIWWCKKVAEHNG